MKTSEFVNENELRKTLAILKPDNEPFEVRIIGEKCNVSGYFHDYETLINAFQLVDLRNTNIYITLNALNDGIDARVQNGHFMKTKVTTSDSDIKGYEWLFIDLDPVRASGISSSKSELDAAIKLAGDVYKYMKGMGFEDPVKALSGNGCHLLYGIRLENNSENIDLVKRCLNVLAMMFNNSMVKVDVTNCNPARICKLHGTLAQKGSNTEDRPHRMSRIFTSSCDVKITPKVFLEKLANELPDEPHEEKTRTYRAETFDLVEFMDHNGMTYSKANSDRATIYRLDYCPFNHSHTNGDAKIFQYTNGAIAFKCHHNSCNGKVWQDVRTLFDPDYGDDTETDIRIQKGYEMHNRIKSAEEVPFQNNPVIDISAFRTASMIQDDEEPEHEYIKSGISVIDNKMMGLEKTCVSVISGLRGCGKSTLIGQLILNAIEGDQTVVCYSGELNNKKYLNWIMRQAAGKTYVEESNKYSGGYGVNREIRNKIAEWMGDRFWLYNNRCGNKFSSICDILAKVLKEKKADICIIDNMMALDLNSAGNSDKYDAQTSFVWSLKNLAEITNTHIIFVAHPRKATGFLRLIDIAGSSNIANIVDNAFIVHRWNHDFEKGYKEEFKRDPEYDFEKCSNLVEITKDREGGLQDEFIPLFYEESTKRLRNSLDEYVTYGWDPYAGYTPVNDEEVPF